MNARPTTAEDRASSEHLRPTEHQREHRSPAPAPRRSRAAHHEIGGAHPPPRRSRRGEAARRRLERGPPMSIRWPTAAVNAARRRRAPTQEAGCHVAGPSCRREQKQTAPRVVDAPRNGGRREPGRAEIESRGLTSKVVRAGRPVAAIDDGRVPRPLRARCAPPSGRIQAGRRTCASTGCGRHDRGRRRRQQASQRQDDAGPPAAHADSARLAPRDADRPADRPDPRSACRTPGNSAPAPAQGHQIRRAVRNACSTDARGPGKAVSLPPRT